MHKLFRDTHVEAELAVVAAKLDGGSEGGGGEGEGGRGNDSGLQQRRVLGEYTGMLSRTK